MKHVTALAVKFIIIAVVLQIILGLYTNLAVQQILIMSLAVTAATYLTGDLLILYVFDNATAAVADAGMCWLIVYLGNYIWPAGNISLISALTAAAVTGIGEVFLHRYVEDYILHTVPDDPDADIAG